MIDTEAPEWPMGNPCCKPLRKKSERTRLEIQGKRVIRRAMYRGVGRLLRCDGLVRLGGGVPGDRRWCSEMTSVAAG